MRENTKDIRLSELKINEFFQKNKTTMVSKIIFSIRARTLDIKEYNAWKYENNLYILCYEESENIEHFFNCVRYREPFDGNWTNIYDKNCD